MEKFTNIIAESINELGLFDKNKQYSKLAHMG